MLVLPTLDVENHLIRIQVTLQDAVEASNEPPSKKRKLGGSHYANIGQIHVHNTGNYIVVTTGEDKTVRVFSFSTAGVLDELSKR
jgi:hypothetical protein